MEMIMESIAATCPVAFSQPANDLFLRAVTAVVAAHCNYASQYQWPKDDADDIIARSNDVSYDFIVIGAGTAGSLVASQISIIDPNWKVLLIEAGDDPDPITEVPSLVFYNLFKSLKEDWSYKAEPSNNTCLALKDNSSLWHKGKAMGGSSSINAMLYVRGHPDDFNSWAAEGNPGWSYKDVLPHFENIERKFKLSEYQFPHNPWYDLFNLAWNEVGYDNYRSNHNEALVGTTVLRSFVSQGKRINTGQVYLKETKNLYIMKNSRVEKLITDVNSKTISGVEIRHRDDKKIKIKVNKEIILSAGSIATPHLLMLSGFGPKKHLTTRNIDVINDLEVGKNLQDHLTMLLIMTMNQKTILSPEKIAMFLLEYMLNRTGPIATIGTFDYVSFTKTDNKTNHPNIQVFNTYYTANDTLGLKTFLEAIGLKDYVQNNIMELNKENDVLIIYPTLLHPKSKGEILLDRENPKGNPKIIPNYYSDKTDMDTMLQAIELVKKLQNSQIFKSLGVNIADIKLEKCKNFAFDTKKYWKCYARHMSTSVFHPVGTAKMGPKENGCVVDQNLLVHGTKNLRVVDASIMPNVPGGNIMAATLMIADKAVDIIKKEHATKTEL